MITGKPKIALLATLIVALVCLWAYLAGGIFLVAFGHPFDHATPLTLYQYWYHYGTAPQVQNWLWIASGVAGAAIVVPAAMLYSPARRSLFGDARFATRGEIRKAGLLGDKGIIVGKMGKKYLLFDGLQHAIISAPTRSGKGVGIVIPNLLNWPDSVVVLDIKQENWDITSGYRRKYGQACYLFNPAATDYRTHRYNPLAYISSDPNFRIDDVQKIAGMLFPDQAGTDIIWTATPRSLFLGIVLYLAETPDKPLTLGQVLRETLMDGDGSAYFARIIRDRAAGGNPLSAVCVRALNSYISISSDKTRAGVMASLRSRLELWMNPLVDAATSANDFDLRDVRKRRMSIYLGVTPDNLERMAPLLNLFFQQLIDLNTRERPNQNPAIQHQCLLLMDEFTAIGKIGILSKGISYIAGYWLRMMPIIQSPSQLVEVYGQDAAQNFTTNHALNIIYPPKASETVAARDISEWLGYQTVKGRSESRGKGLFTKKSKSENVSDQRRALLLPQEITGLGQERELLVLENVPPILAKKVRYFEDPVFVERLREVSPQLAKLQSAMPNQAQLDQAIESGELGAPVPKLDLAAYQHEIGGALAAKGKAVIPEDLPQQAKRRLAEFSVGLTPVAPALDVAALKAHAEDLERRAV